MEEKVNIAEILKNKQKGIRLYSPIFGECAFCYVREDTNDICVKKRNGVIEYFNSEGLYFDFGEVMLFPSKSMRDWEKFSWKNGNVLKNTAYEERVIFDGFLNDDYTYFKGKHPLDCSDKFNISYHEECNCFTGNYRLESTDAAQTYIKTIEERLGGNLNRETLEIEKALPEFKDGDIVVTDAVPSMCYSKCIFILKGDLNKDESRANSYIFYNINNNHISFDVLDTAIRDRNIHLATDSEKLQLFDILTKEGKYWDAEKKQIVDLKPKVELKPFDKVLVRDFSKDKWSISFFSFKKKDLYVCINHCSWNQCIPYNEETSHLLGTTDDWEGGEG